MQRVYEAMTGVWRTSPSGAYWRIQHEPGTLVADVRKAEDLSTTKLIPGAINISLEMLRKRVDNETSEERTDPRLRDRSRPLIVICETGTEGALAAKLLTEMGFEDVCYVAGGMQAWTMAGLPTEQPGDNRPLRDI